MPNDFNYDDYLHYKQLEKLLDSYDKYRAAKKRERRYLWETADHELRKRMVLSSIFKTVVVGFPVWVLLIYVIFFKQT